MRAHEHELKGDAYMRQFEDTGDQRSLDLAHKHWALANQKQTQERQDRAENRSTATTARTGPGLSFGGVIGVVLAALCALIAVWPTLAFAVGLLMLAAPGFVAGWLTSLVDVPGRVRRVDWAHTSTGTRIAVGSLAAAVIAVVAGLAYMLGGDVAGYATFGAVSAPVGYATHHYGLHRALRRRNTAPVTVRIAPPQAELEKAARVQEAHTGLAAALPPAYRAAVEAGTVSVEKVTNIANGVRYTVPLPARVTADQFKARDFAGEQGIPENRIRRAAGPHPGVLLVDVLDMAPEDLPVPAWPLLSGALVDFTRPVPVGVTTAGEVVEATFAANRCIYGGRSGSGKTWAMRLPVIAAALDPKVRLFVIDMKAETDWLPFERVADVFLNNGDHDEAARIVREVVAERRKRARMKRENPGFVPAPLVLVIDEFHNLPEWEGLTELVKEGRSAGITVILGTQAPKGSKIPTDLTAQMNVRWCGRMNIDWQWRLVLGDELNRDDIDTTKVAGKGSAWIVDDDDNANLIRGFKVTDDDIVRALARVPAREPQTPVHDADSDVQDVLDDEHEASILDDVLAMIGTDKGIRWEDLAVALDEDEDDLRAELRELGIKSASYRDRAGASVRGVRRSDVEAIVTDN